MSDTHEAGGRMIGRYRIVDRLGAGGMGVVYRAVDTASDAEGGREIALKLLAPEHVQDEERRRRFLREARVVASLDHPGIVRVHDVGDVDGSVYLAMELVSGVSLRTWLADAKKRDDVRSVADALTIARGIASAVDAAHDKGIVHRDLKPDNVMIEAGLHVRILDFGLAKLREVEGGALYDAETETNLTNDGRVMGTPGYMAPEQATGKEVGLRADVFALGAILYELLTGTRAFTGDSPMDVIVAVTRDEPPAPSTKNAAVGPELDALVARCISKIAESRPSMKELAGALARPSLLERGKQRSARTGKLGMPLVLGILATCGIALAFVFGRAPSHASTAGAASASAGASSAAAIPTAVTELPLPTSAIPEALAAYKKAIADERDGAEDAVFYELEAAIKLDPELAPAQMRLALRQAFIEAQNARAHYSQAAKHRERLSPRDREVLEAMQPLFQRDPADMDEWRRRLEALGTRYPGDAELAYEIASMRGVLGDFAGGNEAAARALKLDPQFGLASSSLAEGQAYLGQFDASRETVARCLEANPSASWCMWVREFIDGQEGRCDAVEASARRRIAVDPTIPDGFKALVFALGALGKPREVIGEAIDQTVQRETDPFRKKRIFLNLSTRLDVLFGDFSAAMKHADELRAHIATRSDVSDHAQSANASAELALETGHPDRAGQIAKSFLDRKEVWQVEPVVHDYALADDLTPALTSFVFHAKGMSKAEFDASLSAWREKWGRGLRGGYRPYLWVYGYTPVVENAEDAAEAMKAFESYGTVPPFLPNGALPFATVGHTLWLGGREDEGIEYLRRAANQCEAIVRPVMWIHAHAWLAEALAKRGDVAGACKALDVVIAHWGAAKPRSVTAEAALTKSRALGCTH